MITSSNMGLKIWNLLTDLFDHSQLADNLTAIDQHDHSSGKGVQIPTGGIADNAITNSKIATGAVSFNELQPNARPLSVVIAAAPTTVTAGQFLDATGTGTVTLPAPAFNTTVGVRNANASSGTITVAPSVGTIFGPGFFGVSTLVLPGLADWILLLGDGANWSVIGGLWDGVILTSKLGSQAVTAAKIANGTITHTQIAAGTIQGANVDSTTTLVVGSLGATGIITGALAATGLVTGNIKWGTGSITVPTGSPPNHGASSGLITHGITDGSGNPAIPRSITLTPHLDLHTLKAGSIMFGVDYFSTAPSTTTFAVWAQNHVGDVDLSGLVFHFDWMAMY